MMKGLIIFIATILIACIFSSFSDETTLSGIWQYAGGVYNGKKENAPVDYTLRRKYDSEHFEAFASDSSNNAEKYEAGDYVLRGDTCIETETYCSQPSKLTGIPVHYFYSVRNDTLSLQATLPSGMRVIEYWKRLQKNQ